MEFILWGILVGCGEFWKPVGVSYLSVFLPIFMGDPLFFHPSSRCWKIVPQRGGNSSLSRLVFGFLLPTHLDMLISSPSKDHLDVSLWGSLILHPLLQFLLPSSTVNSQYRGWIVHHISVAFSYSHLRRKYVSYSL